MMHNMVAVMYDVMLVVNNMMFLVLDRMMSLRHGHHGQRKQHNH